MINNKIIQKTCQDQVCRKQLLLNKRLIILEF